MIALIIAGGFAKRMWPITKDVPKGLLEIKGKSILQWQIELLKKYGITEVVICTGYLADKIEEKFEDGSSLGVRIKYSIEKEPLGTGGALKNARKYIKESFIDINGDLFFDVNLKKFIEFHKEKKGIASIALHKSDHIRDSDIVNIDNNKRVVSVGLGEGNITKSGIHIFEPEFLGFIPSGFISREEVLKKLLIEGKQVYGYVTDEFMKDIGTFGRFNAVKELIEG